METMKTIVLVFEDEFGPETTEMVRELCEEYGWKFVEEYDKTKIFLEVSEGVDVSAMFGIVDSSLCPGCNGYQGPRLYAVKRKPESFQGGRDFIMTVGQHIFVCERCKDMYPDHPPCRLVFHGSEKEECATPSNCPWGVGSAEWKKVK